mmetsp:Transcript_9906/g.20717  ORF Transcript_9906/g.20717 Transcript_9906/m.20717 type:complete len:227 (+) Transcript_9906:552-1232(+)
MEKLFSTGITVVKLLYLIQSGSLAFSRTRLSPNHGLFLRWNSTDPTLSSERGHPIAKAPSGVMLTSAPQNGDSASLSSSPLPESVASPSKAEGLRTHSSVSSRYSKNSTFPVLLFAPGIPTASRSSCKSSEMPIWKPVPGVPSAIGLFPNRVHPGPTTPASNSYTTTWPAWMAFSLSFPGTPIATRCFLPVGSWLTLTEAPKLSSYRTSPSWFRMVLPTCCHCVVL